MRATTDYDFAHLVDLQRMGSHTGNRQWNMLRRGIALAAAGACIFLGVSILVQTNGNVGQAAVYFLLGALLIGVSVFFYQFSAWRLKRRIGKNRVSDQFSFEEDGVDITRGEQSAHYPYKDCDNLLETELAFYLFHRQGKGLVISKSRIEGGSPDDLRALLEEKCQVQARWVGRSTKV